MRQRLQQRAALEVPEFDGCIIPTSSQHVSSGGNGQTLDAVGMPVRPDQRSTGYIPELNRVVPAPTDQHASIKAESESIGSVGVCLPDQVQDLTSLLFPLPHSHFPPLASRRPVMSITANGDCCDDIE